MKSNPMPLHSCTEDKVPVMSKGVNIPTIDGDSPEYQEILATATRLREIEAKDQCGGVRALDWPADYIETGSAKLHAFSKWVRNCTTKIEAPCIISTKKK